MPVIEIIQKQAQLAELCKEYNVQRLELFGSAAGESFDAAHSDLDFLVTFLPCTPVQHYERYFSLLESLEALFGRKADLVEESALRNPYFIEQVNATKISLYAARSEEVASRHSGLREFCDLV